MQHAVLCEGAGAHEVVDGLALISKPGLSIRRHDALPSEVAHRGAEVDVRPLAELAGTAVGLVARDHLVPRPEVCDTLANALHNASGLVAEDAGEETLGVAAIKGVSICVAERHGHVLDTHLALLRCTHCHRNHLQRLLRLEGNCGEALDILASCGESFEGARSTVDRGRRELACVWAPPQHACEVGRMVLQVVLNEARDEIVGVVIAGLHPECERDALLVTGCLERLRAQLALRQKVVRLALVNKDAQGWSVVLLDELNGVVLLPRALVGAQVQGESLLAPRSLGRIRNGGEGGDGLENARILQGDGQCAMATHAVAQDPRLPREDRQRRRHQLWELLGDIVEHVVMLLVLLGGGVEVEACAGAEVERLGILIRDIVSSRRGVWDHEDEPKGGGGLHGAGLLREVLICASEAAQPVDGREKLALLLGLREVGCKLHRHTAEHRAGVLEALQNAAEAFHRRDLLRHG
mmetsp:Transcript_15231/g.31968  ORF Transcript_15231/g.31968 Transcript_15231/m.31968 type:complete len:467 (+) Transcript_15231:755-2155(+)